MKDAFWFGSISFIDAFGSYIYSLLFPIHEADEEQLMSMFSHKSFLEI